MLLNKNEADKNKLVEELEIVAGEDCLMVELPKGRDKWTLVPTEAQIQQMRDAEHMRKDTSIEEFTGKEVDLRSLDMSKVLSNNSRKGLCGLQNLGNTCFMNSALQCLSNTLELTSYFCLQLHKRELNKTNPLGMEGKLALAYAELVQEMWLGSSSRTAPHELKRVIGKRVSKFSGFGQQDSCELLTFVLDLLHEDLNRIVEKPYIEMHDSDGRPDATVS